LPNPNLTTQHARAFATRLRQLLSPIGIPSSRNAGWFDRLAARIRLPADRLFLRRAAALHKLSKLAKSVEGTPDRGHLKPRPRIVVCALRGWADHNAYEFVIAQALRLRGADVTLVTCGGGPPACEQGWPRQAYPRPCDRCAWMTNNLAEASGLQHERLATYLPWGDNPRDAPAEAPSHEPEFDPSAAAVASTIWRLKSGSLENHKLSRTVLADNAVAASGAYEAAQAIFDRCQPEALFMVNGMFAADRGMRAAAIARGIRVPTYEIAPRNGALVFSQSGFAPQFQMDRIWAATRDKALSPDQSQALDTMMLDRSGGRGAHESYGFSAEDPANIRSAFEVPEGDRIVSLLTNIPWDTAFAGAESVYSSMINFVEDAVRKIRDVPQATLIIRSHPAETKWGTDEPVEPALRDLIADMPANVRFVGPEDELNTYGLIDASNLVLSYATTAGLEAALRGRPVIVASNVHYSRRGFTVDLDDAGQLGDLLQSFPPALSDEQIALARRYAFAFFFRLMVSFPQIERLPHGAAGRVPVSAESLKPGVDHFLDFICDAIMTGGEFELPDPLARAPYLPTRHHSDASALDHPRQPNRLRDEGATPAR